VGKRLGEFEFTGELGCGGMGVVYEAVQTLLGRRLVLKVLGPGSVCPPAVDCCRREAAGAAPHFPGTGDRHWAYACTWR
jgi:hypothetical protein